MKGFFETIIDILGSIVSGIVDGIKTILQTLFIPEEGFFDDKINHIREKFSFVDSVIEVGQMFSNTLDTDGTAPVVVANLGNAEGNYDYGLSATAFDVSWFTRYKPVTDKLISAFLWIVFAINLFKHIPSIISGATTAGYIDSETVYGKKTK